MQRISTHVLDTALGKPGRNIVVTLWALERGSSWRQVAQERTDTDGRVREWPGGANLTASRFRLHFATGNYFAARQQPTLYPEIVIEFTVDAESHFHIPLLLGPFSYSTYRGT